ncbi:MAG: PAN domain-containing protein [Persicimonas sp.]
MRNLSRCLAALLFFALMVSVGACQTADRGTSKLSDPDEATEPTEAEPAVAQQAEPGALENKEDAAGFEQDTCRPGAVYRSIRLDEADPAICEQICNDQMRCMAFTYIRAGYDGEKPRCDLKHSVPDAQLDQEECISWVNPRAEQRMAQMREQGFEWNVERPGADFRDFEMDRPTPEGCQEACQNLRECEAFTYKRPGQDGQKAHCYLKNQVPEPVADRECCISGVK